MKRLFWLVLFPLFCPLCPSQELTQLTEHFARERTYDVTHYTLNITIDEKTKTCAGDVHIRLVPLRMHLDEIKFDAAEMKITQVKLQRKQLDFHLSGETLFVRMDKPYGLKDTLDVVVSYSVVSPRKGLYFVLPDSGYPEKRWQVWSQGEAEDNHYWFPCYDFPNDKATSEMIVTVDGRFTAISNGKLIEVTRDSRKHTATYHWLENKPHVSYLISLVVGEYAEIKDSWSGVPLSYYVYRTQEPDAMRSFGKTPKMIEFYSSKIGYPYPWEKYAQTVVEDFIYGGEENVSATTLTDGTIHDARAHLDYSSDGLVAHELAHMWWGDMLTCRDWSHAWLNEGFATYFETAFTENDQGHDYASKEILDNQTTIQNVDVYTRRRPTVCNRYISPMDIFDNRIYGKGAVVLNMLRFVLGDELFWKAINRYAHKFAYQNVETNDFKIAVEEATGYNLHWFFDEWLYKAGYPTFDISSDWDQHSRTVKLGVKQTQKIDSLTGLFVTPVEIEVWVNDVSKTYRVMISKTEETFSFPAYPEPQLIIFDKGSRLLKKTNFQKSLAEWIFQLQHAEEGVDRFLAVEELQWMVDSSLVMNALTQAALGDPFSEVRRDAVWALGDAKKIDTSEKLIAAYGDRDAKVRAAAVTSLGHCKGEKVLRTLQQAFNTDSSYSVAASALRSLTRVDSLHRKMSCEEGMRRSSRNEIIRSTAVQILAEIGDEEAFNMIKSYSRYGVDRNIRIQAINALGSTWKSREEVVQYLISLLGDPSFHVRRTVIAMLGNIGNTAAIEALKRSTETESDSRVVKEAREAIEKITQGHKQDAH